MDFINTVLSNYTIFLYVAFTILLLVLFVTVYEGKDTIVLDTNRDGKTYSEDEKMFLKYYNLLGKRFAPAPDTKEYKNIRELLLLSKKSEYRQVDILYGAKVYYAMIGVTIFVVIDLIPIIFNILNTRLELGLAAINIPIYIYVILPCLGLIFYKYPESSINAEVKTKTKKLEKEILSLGILVHSMLETGNNPYQILEVVKDIKPEFKEDIEKTLNEYYVNTTQALRNLKKRVGIEDFDMIADSLLWAHEADNTFACEFLSDYLNRLEAAQKVNYQKSSSIRPYFLLGASVLPMGGALVVWFYPWMIKAVDMLTNGFGM